MTQMTIALADDRAEAANKSTDAGDSMDGV